MPVAERCRVPAAAPRPASQPPRRPGGPAGPDGRTPRARRHGPTGIAGRKRALDGVGREVALDGAGGGAIATAPSVDPLDLIVGRAAVDSSFRDLLLRDPVGALETQPMPLRLKRALVAVRARDLGEFAVRALDAEHRLRGGERRPA
jgi:hypothetical protein